MSSIVVVGGSAGNNLSVCPVLACRLVRHARTLDARTPTRLSAPRVTSPHTMTCKSGRANARAVRHAAWRERRERGRQWRGLGGRLRWRQSRRLLRSRRRIAFCARSCSPHVQRRDRVDAGPCSTWPGVRAGRMAGGGEECEVDCEGTQVGDLANSLASDLGDEIAISG